MHNTELLTEAMSRPEVGSCADWMRSRANGDKQFDSFALSMLSKCNFAIYSFFLCTIRQCQSKDRIFPYLFLLLWEK